MTTHIITLLAGLLVLILLIMLAKILFILEASGIPIIGALLGLIVSYCIGKCILRDFK